MEVIFDYQGKQASKEWLTFVLKEGGSLTSGEVIELAQQPSRLGETISSEFFKLTIKYSTDSAGSRPSNCLLKVGKPEFFRISKREAAFYTLVGLGDFDLLLKTYGTFVDKLAKSAIILLEDICDENLKIIEWPLSPAIDDCELAIKSLAQVHARWWENPILGSKGFERASGKRIDEKFSHYDLVLATFYDQIGDGCHRKEKRFWSD